MAGRIPQAFLDTLLDRVDIVDVVDRRVKLKKTGKNYSALCPFHQEKSPSFSVNPEKQFYYCFGCGAGGNALGFLMDYENLEFPQAVEQLASSVGLEVPREAGGPNREERDANKALYELLAQAADFYRRQLREHPEAKRAVDYLKGRGLTGVIARDFDIGFAPPGWDNLIQALGQTDDSRRKLLDAGLLVQNDAGRVYDRFRDRVIFPIRDQRGRVIAFGGRVLGDDKPKYLNSPETPVFHKGRELYGLYQARQQRRLERVLVVEGYMDVIALAQHGIGYAVATLGTATSKTHLERLFRMVPEVVFCFDGDEAGRKAAFRALEAALPSMEDGRQARFLFLPEGEDPDTLVRAKGSEHLLHLIDNAPHLEEFLFDAVGEGLDVQSLDGRARLSKMALPYLRQLPEGVYRQLMFSALAERTGLPLEQLMQLEAAKHPPPIAQPGPETSPHGDAGPPTQDTPPWDGAPPHDAPGVPAPPNAPPKGFANLAQSAIALLLHRPDVAAAVRAETLRDLPGPDIDLLRQLLEHLQRRPESSTAALLGHWYGTREGELMSRLASQERLIPSEGIEQQFVDTVGMLSRRTTSADLAAAFDKLRGTNYADLSELEKLKLKEKLSQLRELKKSPGNPTDES